MQRVSNSSAVNELSINELGDVLGVVERGFSDGGRLVLTIGSRLSYNDLVNKLLIGSYIVIVDSSIGNEVLLRVGRVENMGSSPLSVSGVSTTYVRVFGEFVISRVRSNGVTRYTSSPAIPTSGSLVVYPSGDAIRDFLGLRGDLMLGKALINGYEIPITLNEGALAKGLLIVGQPGCGKSLLIKRLIKELGSIGYENIVVLDRTGEYVRDLIRGGVDISALIPMDLMRLDRPIEVDELKRYIIDRLRVFGFRRKAKVLMSISKSGGVEFNVDFLGRGLGRLVVIPLSIRFRWFIERAINYLDPRIRHVITALMMEDENALSTVQAFINAIKDSGLVDMVGRESVNEAIDLAYTLKDSGLFDATINAGGEKVDISVFSPLRALRNGVVVIDLHELPTSLMNIYETILIEDIVKWFMKSNGGKAIVAVDNAEELMSNEALLDSLINSVRVGRHHGISFIVATNSFSGRLSGEFGNLIVMRMGKPINFNCPEGANLLNNEFVLMSPLLNVNCIKGSIT